VTPARVLTRRHYLILTAAFAAFVVFGTFVPFTTRPLAWDVAVETFARRMGRGLTFESRSDWAANVVLFVPLGFLAAGAVAVDRKRPVAILALIPAMTAFSAAMEFAQVWFPTRTSSVNDVAAETVGGIGGVATWLLVGQEITARVRGVWAGFGPGERAARALIAYVLFLVIAHGMPFDLTLSPWQIRHKYLSGLPIDAPPDGAFVRLQPHPSILAEKTLLHLVYFLPFGILLARLPGARWRRPRALGLVFAVGLLVAGGVEAVQLIVLSAPTYASDVPLGALVVVAGWKLATRARPFTRTKWAFALFAWVAGLVLVSWAPFQVSTDQFGERLGRGAWLPFAEYDAGNYLGAFNRILDQALVYVPIGFLATRVRRVRIWPAPLAAAGLAAVIEVGQALMTDHAPASSDVILGAVGTGFGAMLAHRRTAAPEPRPNGADGPVASRFCS
jgi:VanZ family protein